MQIEILSDDVLREIFLFLQIEHLPSVLLASRHLNQIADSETQWRLVYLSLAAPPIVPAKKDADSIAESLSKLSVNAEADRLSEKMTQQQTPRDKMFPHETWKYNVQMTRHHRWSPCFVNSEGIKVMNPLGPIIDESTGRLLRFVENQSTTRTFRTANTMRPINTRGWTRIDLKVQMCLDNESKVDTVPSFCSSWVLLGIIEESILRDLYAGNKHGNVYLGVFQPGENIAYANNGYFYRNKIDRWTDKFYSGDVITFIVDAEHEYEEAKESNWKKPYGRFTCLLNGVEDEQRSYDGIFAKPDARIYFCVQVNEDRHENGIVTTIQYA